MRVKQGIPEEGEIVLCTVTKVQYHSVFVSIDEYGKQGMLHISEIAAGRIRNIRDYVKEGKVIVCTILRVDKERGHIDVSLRRVTDMQRQHKMMTLKQEQRAEKIIGVVAHDLKIDPKKVYQEITPQIFAKYDLLYPCFEEVANDRLAVKDLNVPQQYITPLDSAIRQRIKPPEVFLKGAFSILSYDSNGIEVVKQALHGIAKHKNVTLKYLGGGKYSLQVKGEDYKSAERLLKDLTTDTLAKLKKHTTTAEFIREETK